MKTIELQRNDDNYGNPLTYWSHCGHLTQFVDLVS